MRAPSLKVFAPLVAVLAFSSCSELTGSGDCSGGVDIAVGEVRNGTLQAGDDLDVDGAYLDPYALRVSSDQTVNITMTSTAVDAWLWLLDDDGNVLDVDDDSAGGTNALITIPLSRGCYVVEATSYSPGETGSYTVSVN
jgi:hypothetical protein